MVALAVILSLGACDNKKETHTPAAAPAPPPPVAVQPTVVAPPAAVTPAGKTGALTPDERAAKLGFVKYLPQDTEVVMAFHNGLKSADRVTSSKLWKLVQGRMGMGGGAEPDENAIPGAGKDMKEEGLKLPEGEPGTAAKDAKPVTAQGEDPTDAAGNFKPLASPDAEEEAGPATLLGTEFTLALGKSAGEQSANLLTTYRRMTYFQMRMLAKAFATAAKAGDFSTLEQTMSEQYGPQLFKDLLADPESGVGMFERMKMPPVYLAFRTSLAARPAAAQQVAAMIENLGMMGEMVEPVETEAAGQKFVGHKISGEKIADEAGKNREELDKMLGAAIVDKLLAALAKKSLVAVSGTLGDYVVLFIGSSVDDLKFATAPAQSLGASAALAFCDPYAAKELAAVIYGQKGAVEKLIAASGGLADMTAGLRDGLAGTDGLGDTRDLEALLRMVGERESALRKLIGTESLGVAAFFENGLKIESFGGTDNGAIDWKASNKLAALGNSDDVVMFADVTKDAAHDEKTRAYVEALMETAYALAMKASELRIDDEQMAKFKQMAQLFDTKFRPEAVAMWEAFSGDFSSSLGGERAFVMDLNGAMPAIPGVPQVVVDQGKFPRMSIVAPVNDRAKLAASWDKMNTSITSILGKVSEMTGEKIPMQKPISSDKGGFTTWFFSLPFFSDDFMPSVTVGDKWFVASTSKNQALDLVNKAAKGGETTTGVTFTINFKAMRKFSAETLKMLDKNSAAIFGEGTVPADKMATAKQLIEAMDDLDKLTMTARREAGVLRTSVHLKTR